MPIIMGSYGIGISRLLSAISEQNADSKGLVWPTSVAPYDVHIIPIDFQDDVQVNIALNIESTLSKQGFDVLLDDRGERAGVKFADSDLIGIPLRITIGRLAKDGIVELKLRQDKKTTEVNVDEVAHMVQQLLTK